MDVLLKLNSEGENVDKICDHLFEEVRRVYSEEKKLPYDLLSALQFVFQGPLLSALELVENDAVTKITSPSQRELFTIIGTSGKPYICFPNLKYCSCPAYLYSVLISGDYIMCKHMLAMQLSVAMGSCKELSLLDDEITKMIQDID